MDDGIKLTMLRHDSPTGKTCPAVYDTHCGAFHIVGKKVSNPALLAQMAIADDETVVEVPATLLPELVREVTPDA